MPAADTEPQSDTTPPLPAAAGKAGGKKAAATQKQAPSADAAEPAADETPSAPAGTTEADADGVPEPPAPEPGWFRNTAKTELVVMPVHYPSRTLAPDEAMWLPDDPHHPNLVPCDAPDPDAAADDTTGSEQ